MVFDSAGALTIYDDRGCRTMHHANWDTSPKLIAKALMKCDRDKRKITSAKWL